MLKALGYITRGVKARERESVRPEKIPIFGKRVNHNFGKNPKFFYILDDETDFTVGIIL